MRLRELAFLLIGALALDSRTSWSQSGQVAAADEASTVKEAPAGAGASDKLDEVIVTAQRRTTSLMQTAISVDALSGDTLAQRQQNTVADLQKTTPNFQVNTTGLYNSINIRGIGNSAITPTIQPGIAVLHDGLLSPETIFIDTPFYDIADVEVLRGPQGTLLSAASTGGAVEINSRSPELGRGANGYAEALIGNYSDHRVHGAINLPVSDTFAARLAFNVEKRGSFYYDVGSKLAPGPSNTFDDPGRIDQQNVRIGLLWQPTEHFSALLKAEFDYNNYGGQAAEPNPGTFPAVLNPTSGTYAACPNPLNNPDPAVPATCQSPYYQYGTGKPFVLNYGITGLEDRQTLKRFGLDLRYTLPSDIVFRSLTGYQSLNSIEVEDPNVSSAMQTINYWNNTGPHDDYYSEDLSITSPGGGKLNWIVGADIFYRHTPVNVNQQTYLSFPFSTAVLQKLLLFVTPPGQGNAGATLRTEGLFGNLDWNFTDTLQLDVGLRGNWDQGFNRGTVDVYINGFQVVSVPPSKDFTDNVPTGKVGLNWTPLKGQFFYLFYARGYKPGGSQYGAPTFSPEHVNDFELGWKGHLLDDHLQVQLGGYYMKYQEMQFTGFDTTSGSGSVTNIGNSTIDGIELSTVGRFGYLGVDLGLAYLHSRLGSSQQVETYKLPSTLPSNTPQCNGTNAANCFDYAPYEVSVNGEANPYSPKVSASLGVDYGFLIGPGVVRPRLTYSYTSKQYAALFQTDNYWQMGSRRIWDGSVEFDTDKWVVQLYCNNFTNQTYFSGVGNITGGPAGSAVFYGAPRQYGLRVNREF